MTKLQNKNENSQAKSIHAVKVTGLLQEVCPSDAPLQAQGLDESFYGYAKEQPVECKDPSS